MTYEGVKDGVKDSSWDFVCIGQFSFLPSSLVLAGSHSQPLTTKKSWKDKEKGCPGSKEPEALW